MNDRYFVMLNHPGGGVMQTNKMSHEPKGFTRMNDFKEEAWAELAQITRLELTNSQIEIVKKGLEMVNDMLIGFEKSIKTTTEKLKTSGSGWRPPATAPKDGAVILGAFGYPWATLVCWNKYEEQWVFANLQMNTVEGIEDPYFETDRFESHELRGWMPLPDVSVK